MKKLKRRKCATRGCKNLVHGYRIEGAIFLCTLCRNCCRKGFK